MGNKQSSVQSKPMPSNPIFGYAKQGDEKGVRGCIESDRAVVQARDKVSCPLEHCLSHIYVIALVDRHLISHQYS